VTAATPALGLPETLLPRGWADAVGFARVEGRLCVAFPKVYDSWHERLLANAGLRTRHLVLLVRVLAKYLRAVGPQSAASSGIMLERDPGMLDWLEAACELYDDYQENGLYWIKRDKLSSRAASGAITWRATLSTTPAHLTDGVPVYLDVVRRTRSRSTEDLLPRLHACVVDEVAKLLTGRSLVVESARVTTVEMDAIRSAPRPTFMALARSTYSDRGKRLLSLIQRYLHLSGAAETRFANGALLCSADAFELVWEHMLRVAIENAKGAALVRMPAGMWTDADGLAVRGIAPRPDFGFVATADGEIRLAIFDAKDKPIAKKGRSGTEQDHYKQITYRLLGAYDVPVWNALLFPSLERGRPDAPFTALGCHAWQNCPATLVYEIAADYPTVCTAFLAGRRLDPTPVLIGLAPA